MEPAELRDRVVIQTQSTTSTSDLGHPYENWVTASTVWASVNNLGGREAYYAKQVQPDATHRITIRDGVAVAVSQRMTMGSRTFNILDVQRDGDPNGYQTVIVQEVL